MKRWMIAAGLLVSLAVQAEQSPYKAMVLKVQGKPTAHPMVNVNEPVITGQRWDQGWEIDLPPGSKLTVLLLEKGERLEIAGSGKVKVTAKGLDCGSCATTSLASTQHRLSLTGENHRQIGGITMRGASNTGSLVDNIEVAEQGKALLISCPASQGQPPELNYQYYYYFSQPNFNSTLQVVRQTDSSTLQTGSLKGIAQGSRWQWSLPIPQSEPRSTLGLRLSDAKGTEWLYTKAYVSTGEDQSSLASARSDLEGWATQEPESPEPWLVYATLLEEKGYLQEAQEKLARALQLQPKDPGLIQMQIRLLVDLGRYEQARELLKRQPPQ